MSTHLSIRLRQSLFCLLVLGLAVAPSRAEVSAGPPTAAAVPVAAALPTPTPARVAAPDSEGYTPESRPATMSTVEEGIPAAPLVATAYGFIWVAVLVFVGFTARRTRHLEGELAELAERLSAAQTSSPS